jgi:N-acetylmuramoyl-L-alanine amidase
MAIQVVSQREWGAAPTRVALPARGPLDHLVLHHTAYPTSRIGKTFAAESAHMREIQRWHVARGWATVGYHFVVSPTGRIFLARPPDRLGAHVLGHNVGTVGIALMGNFELERPSKAALDGLDHARRRLVPGAAGKPLLGHRDHTGQSTACPGRYLEPHAERREGPPRGGPSQARGRAS